MGTNILQLPKLSIPCEIETNETWTDAIAFTDANNNPVALDGIAFTLAIREQAASEWVVLTASSDDYIFALPASPLVALNSGGSGYAVNEQITLPGGLVLQVGNEAGGVIESVSIKTLGSFSTRPSNPVAQVSTSGLGTDAAFDLAWVNNALAIIMPPAILSNLQAGSYVYEIKAVADGYALDVVTGALTVNQGVVR